MERKLSKIETLTLAKNYIMALTNVICDIRGDEKPFRCSKRCSVVRFNYSDFNKIFPSQIGRFISTEMSASDSEALQSTSEDYEENHKQNVSARISTVNHSYQGKNTEESC